MKHFSKVITLLLVFILSVAVLPTITVMAAHSGNSPQSVPSGKAAIRLLNPRFQDYCNVVFKGTKAVHPQPGYPDDAYGWRCRKTNGVWPVTWYTYKTIDVNYACRITYYNYNNVYAKLEQPSHPGGWYCYGQ